MSEKEVTASTGALFGALWKPYDDEIFEQSVGLFRKRFEANGFDLGWLKGKKCLDVGCGGGRYCVAMAREGAGEVVGVDVGAEGLEDARRRARDYPQVSFQYGSALELPFGDGEFDFVLSSGVLHHTAYPEAGFREVCRVLRPGGKLYLLLYSTGGVRWPAVMDYRGALKGVSADELKEVMTAGEFPANKVRTIVDDLKAPIMNFYTWEYVEKQLRANGIGNIERWTAGRFDHEESLSDMIEDMEWFRRCFELGSSAGASSAAFGKALGICDEYLAAMRKLDELAESGGMEKSAAERVIIGCGHHRLIGEKA